MAMFGTLGHIWGSNLALMAKFVVVEDFRGRNWHSWPDLGKETCRSPKQEQLANIAHQFCFLNSCN
jgi:hypothetical protein